MAGTVQFRVVYISMFNLQNVQLSAAHVLQQMHVLTVSWATISIADYVQVSMNYIHLLVHNLKS